jgi:hypothetical protein
MLVSRADTLPLPFVPAMWIVGRVYGGKCVLSERIRVRPRSMVDIESD